MPQAIREKLILAGIALVSALIASVGLRQIPALAAIETWVMDLRVATVLPAEPQHPDIVFVAITEETLERFPYRSPVDRRFMAELVRTLEQRGARGIFIDMLFDQPTEADKDAELKTVLAGVKVPLAISYGLPGPELTETQVEYMDGFLPPASRAFANLLRDPVDSVVRWIYPGGPLPDGGFLAGAGPGLLRQLGYTVPEFGMDKALAYRGRPDSETPAFRQFPAHAVKLLPAAWFKDKIVIIGVDLSDRDRHRTPFVADSLSGGTIPGALIHAHAMAQLMDGREAPDRSLASAFLAALAAALAGVALGRWEVPLWARVAIGVGIAVAVFAGGTWLFHEGGPMLPAMPPILALGFGLWMTDIHSHRQERDQRRFIQAAFSKYLSPALLDELVKDPSKLSLDPKRREMSFIFTDVAGFTTISESMDAAQLADVMNRYLDGMVKVIFAHGGTVDKFIGDAVFAIFNAPKDMENHALKASACALALDAFATEFLGAELAAGRSFGLTRIGIHTGFASVGNFGAQERFEYTALGDAVNTAARLEGLNKYFGTRVAMSGATADGAAAQPRRPIGRIVLKGKTEPIRVYQPVSAREAESDFIKAYLAAYELMDRGDPAALEAFRDLARANPEDGPTRLHLDRLEAGEASSLVVMHDK